MANPTLIFDKQNPLFYAGDELHREKQRRVQRVLAESDFDALLFFKAEAVRYITDFYVKGYRPFMEPEYAVLVAKHKAPVVGYVSGSDDLRIRVRSDIEDARRVVDGPPVLGVGERRPRSRHGRGGDEADEHGQADGGVRGAEEAPARGGGGSHGRTIPARQRRVATAATGWRTRIRRTSSAACS